MKLTLTEDLKKAAANCVWFEQPEQSLQDIPRLAAYIFTYGAPEDTQALMDQLDADGLAECLDHAPPGIYDPRSWAYWNLMAGRDGPPPLPERTFE